MLQLKKNKNELVGGRGGGEAIFIEILNIQAKEEMKNERLLGEEGDPGISKMVSGIYLFFGYSAFEVFYYLRVTLRIL